MTAIDDAFALAAKSVVDGIDAAEADAKAYTDTAIAGMSDAAVLAEAKAYTDQQIAALEDRAIDEAELDAKLNAAFTAFRQHIDWLLLHDPLAPKP